MTWIRALTVLLLAPISASVAKGSVAAQASMADRALRPEQLPAWAGAPVSRELELHRDPALGDTANGARLAAAVQALQPGDRLRVGSGVWSVDSLFTVVLQGTALAPIRIEALPGATPVLTRPNALQNLVNFGDGTQTARFVLVRGFELTGGSIGVRVRRGDDLWFDCLHIHHVGSHGLRAAEFDTARLFVTRCEVHHTGLVHGTGDGLYVGANSGTAVAREAVIALNHVHDTFGTQGDGIELKQGSAGCLIAENVVHDTQYPGVLVYGTAGGARNVIEGNIVWATQTNPFQVQGEALVRNNIVFGGSRAAFVSFDHQGAVRDLEVVHNTFIATSGEAARLQHWGGRPGMVLANNALYSQSGTALLCLSGMSGVDVVGNVVFGSTWNDGGALHRSGGGESDFVDMSFDGARRDVHPNAASALIGFAAAAHHAPTDRSGALRTALSTAGAFEPGTYGRYLGDSTGLSVRTSGALTAGGPPVTLTVQGGPSGAFGVLGELGTSTLQRTLFALDGNGSVSLLLAPWAGPRSSRCVVRDAQGPGGTRLSQWIEWRP